MTLDKIVENHYDELNETDLYIWQYILHHKVECQKMSIKELANNCNVSHTSVLRFTKKIGLEGFSELKVHLKWDLTQKSEFEPQLIEETYHEFNDTMQMMMKRDFTHIMELIYNAERVFVYGTGVVQQHVAAEMRREFLYAKKVFHLVGSGDEIDTILNNVTKRDLFIIISLSGDNEIAVTLSKALKGMRVPRIGIAKSAHCLLSKYCDAMIDFKYAEFKIGKENIFYGSSSHFFIISSFLFLRYLEYLHYMEE